MDSSRIPVELFKTLKDDTIKVFHSNVSKSGRPSSDHRTGKGQYSSQFPRRVVLKNVLANHWTVALISHDSKVVLKILHARLQYYTNQELPDVQDEFRKGRVARDQIEHLLDHRESKGIPENIYLDYGIVFDCVDLNKLCKAFTEMGIQYHLTCYLRTCMQVKKQQLEPVWNN